VQQAPGTPMMSAGDEGRKNAVSLRSLRDYNRSHEEDCVWLPAYAYKRLSVEGLHSQAERKPLGPCAVDDGAASFPSPTRGHSRIGRTEMKNSIAKTILYGDNHDS